MLFYRTSLEDRNFLQGIGRIGYFPEGSAAGTIENDTKGAIFNFMARYEDDRSSEIGIKQGRRGDQK